MVVTQLLPPHVIKAITEAEQDSQETGAPCNHGYGSSESLPPRAGSGLDIRTVSQENWQSPSIPSVRTVVTDASRNPMWGRLRSSTSMHSMQFSEPLDRVCLLFADVEGFTGICFSLESVL